MRAYPEAPTQEEKAAIVAGFIERDLREVSEKRYTLILKSSLIEGEYGRRTGRVTDNPKIQVGSDDLQYLRDFWQKNEVARLFDTTVWHYIWDNQEKKLVEVLSYSW